MDGWAGRCWTELLDCAASTRLHVATDSEARMPADAHPEMPPAPVLLMHATRTPPGPPSLGSEPTADGHLRTNQGQAEPTRCRCRIICNQSSIGDHQPSTLWRPKLCIASKPREKPQPPKSAQSNAGVCPRFGVHSHANTSMNLSPEAFLCSCFTASSCISGNLQLAPPSSSKSLWSSVWCGQVGDFKFPMHSSGCGCGCGGIMAPTERLRPAQLTFDWQAAALG